MSVEPVADRPTRRPWTRKVRALAVMAPLTIALAVAPAAEETIGGFCRQLDSANILPLMIDSATGAARSLPAAALGADHAGHFASVARVDVPGSRRLVTGFRPAGATASSLATVNLDTGAVQLSTNPLPAAAFPGHSMVTIPGADPWAVLIAPDAGRIVHLTPPANDIDPNTGVLRVDVATGTVAAHATMPSSAAARLASDHRSLAHLVIDPTRPRSPFLLQPCTFNTSPSPLQQLVGIDLGTAPWTIGSPVDLVRDTCADAPGANVNGVFALGTDGRLGSVSQLVRVDTTTGAKSLVGTAPAGFRRSTASPYAYSAASHRLYALSDTQTLLATYDLLSGVTAVTPFTIPAPCAPLGVTSLAVLP